MSKRFIGVLVACILVLVGIYALTSKKSDNNTNNNSTAQPTAHVTGKNSKNVVLIEYGDFQCPACKAYYPIVKQIVKKYSNDIEFQFRNFPIATLHPNARAGARAAEAAGLQGKYWEMHDMLYEQQDTWANSNNSASVFEGYAQQLGLNLEQFKTDYASSAVNDAIQADIKRGEEAGVGSTPTFVLNGKKLDKNPASVEEFDKLIADTITSQSKK